MAFLPPFTPFVPSNSTSHSVRGEASRPCRPTRRVRGKGRAARSWTRELALPALLLLLAPSNLFGQGSVPVSGTAALDGTNGNAFVQKLGTMHLVLVQGGGIYYRASVAGQPWSGLAQVSGALSGCSSPTVAADDQGTVGIAFVCNSDDLYYVNKPSGSPSFSPPEQVTPSGHEPSMVGSGTSMHLTWRDYSVYYAELSSTEGPPPGWDWFNDSELVSVHLLCGLSYTERLPSITVIPGTGSGDKIYISNHTVVDATQAFPECLGDISSGITITERFGPNNWLIVPTGGRHSGSTNAGVVSNSITSDSEGNVIVAFSDFHEGTGTPTDQTVMAFFATGDTYANDITIGSYRSRVDVLSTAPKKFLLGWNSLDSGQCGNLHVAEVSYLGFGAPTVFAGDLIHSNARDPHLGRFGRISKGCLEGGCQVRLAYQSCSPTEIRIDQNCPAQIFPTLHYTFDHPTDPGRDDSGKGHDALVGPGATTGVKGFPGEAVQFDGIDEDQDLSTPHMPDLDLPGAMTGMAYVWPSGTHSANNNPSNCVDGTVFTKGGSHWLQILQDNSGILYQNEGGGTDYALAMEPVTVGTWNHVAFTRDASGRNVKIYLNGQLVETHTMMNDPGLNMNPFEVGSLTGDVYGLCEFEGLIDEVKIYPVECAEEDMLFEYKKSLSNGIGPQNVPTLSTWAMILFGLGIAGLGLWVLRGFRG